MPLFKSSGHASVCDLALSTYDRLLGSNELGFVSQWSKPKHEMKCRPQQFEKGAGIDQRDGGSSDCLKKSEDEARLVW